MHHGPPGLSPEIEEFRQQFERLAADADALAASLTDEQFSWQPAPHIWSVAHCLDHLNATARTYLPALDDGIADAIRRGLYSPGPFVYNWLGRAWVWYMEPPPRVRTKAPKAFQPTVSRPRKEIMAAFGAYHAQYLDRLRRASGLHLARARVASPIVKWLRLPLGSAFALMVAHERRHLEQARRVISAPGFPR